jgi:hypothetical protein
MAKRKPSKKEEPINVQQVSQFVRDCDSTNELGMLRDQIDTRIDELDLEEEEIELELDDEEDEDDWDEDEFDTDEDDNEDDWEDD